MYRIQSILFALRRYVPAPLRQALKPLFRRWWQRSARKRIAAALASAPPVATPAGYAILCFSAIDWELRFQRPQQLLTRLARSGHRVYYLRTDFARGHSTDRLEPLAPNVYGLRLPGPSSLSLYQDPPSGRLVTDWVALLDGLFRSEGVTAGVCLVQSPFWASAALAMGRSRGWKVVYDCLDDQSGFTTTHPAVLAAEAELVAKSDLVLTTARLLYEKHAPRAQRAVLLPNAADYDHFGSAQPRPMLAQLQRPIIGYYGALSEWFEVEWVRAAALAHPEWSFVLIGLNSGLDLRQMERLSNVHLLGERPYAELPAYLHCFDVALIPFKLNALTCAANPVKFYEYLSAGRPVVATALPELMPHAALFYPARDQGEFIRQLEAAVAERDPERRAMRVAFARENNWEARVAQFEQAVAALYGSVAIVIVSYRNREYLQLCLDSLWAKTDCPRYCVIVVDNDSGPEMVDYLRAEQARQPRLTVRFNSENLGFARAINQGLRLACDCEYVILLNDDTVVTPGWLSRLVQHLQADATLGMIGPQTNWASDAAKISPGYDRVEQLDEFAVSYTRPRTGRLEATSRLDMFCVALRRKVIDEVGPLDESYGLGMFEDDDYALRLTGAGYHLSIATDVYVHHWGWTSFGRLTQAE
jgi:GT2 family glycosyltransferase/glycosyltransferase involved in cell wall biosynthesis